ncbi:MAG: DEAD/DEAH box helicase [Saprospiraceae bacterium]
MPNILDDNVLSLHDEQHYALDRLDNTKGVIFITGKAGTGKSTLFNLYNRISKKKTVVLAPTGIAAINVGGQTIHSFFRFPPGFVGANDLHPLSKSLVKKIELIVIDEISMVRADMLDNIDKVLRISTQSNVPFGGIPMVWIGDLYQLPPIVSSAEEREYFSKYYESPYFFSANVMKQLEDFELIELNQVFRQKDQHFIKLLNKIRVNEIDEEEFEYLNERLLPIPEDSDKPFISLCTTNAIANQINSTELAKLNVESRNYQAHITGSVSASQFPVEQQLVFKIGAQVMTIRNSTDKTYVNGSLGIVEELGVDYVKVKFHEIQESIKISKISWEIIRYKAQGDELKKETIGSYEQLPLRLAWAVTVHKSQGKSFDQIIVDFGRGAFETGQAYVALSRCRTLDGIYLKQKLNWRDIRTDERVSEFLRKYS